MEERYKAWWNDLSSSAIEEAAAARHHSSCRHRQPTQGSLQEMVGGFDFATVIKAYWQGSRVGTTN